MAAMNTQVKRRRIESDETYAELFGREDSDEEFEGFDIDEDEEQGFAEINKDEWIDGCNRDPKLFHFEENLSG